MSQSFVRDRWRNGGEPTGRATPASPDVQSAEVSVRDVTIENIRLTCHDPLPAFEW
jgi:hypothetical protein